MCPIPSAGLFDDPHFCLGFWTGWNIGMVVSFTAVNIILIVLVLLPRRYECGRSSLCYRDKKLAEWVESEDL